MRKLFIILSIALAACGPYPQQQVVMDPCDQSVFDQALCQAAIAQQGYYYQGNFVHVHYVQPLTYYSHVHTVYVDHGGRYVRPNVSYYSRSYAGPRTVTSTRVVVPQTRIVTPSPYTPRSGTIRGMSMSRTYRPRSPRTYSSGRRR